MTATPTNAAAVEALADAITDKLLGVREHYLPSHDGNGTEAPADRAAYQVRREMKARRNRAVRSLLVVAFADADDSRIPTELVASALDEIAEAVRARGRDMRREPFGAPSIRPLMKRLMTEMSEASGAALDVEAEPENVLKLDVAERELVEVEQACLRTRRAVGARRASTRAALGRHAFSVAR